MSSNVTFFVELALFEGAAVVWGVWEFWSARPTKKPKSEEPISKPAKSTDPSGHPEG
jgi:hypothetical protein